MEVSSKMACRASNHLNINYDIMEIEVAFSKLKLHYTLSIKGIQLLNVLSVYFIQHWRDALPRGGSKIG